MRYGSHDLLRKRSGEGNDVITGSEGDDRLYGDAQDPSSTVEVGNDTLLGREGTDTIYGGTGDDSVYAFEEYKDVADDGLGRAYT